MADISTLKIELMDHVSQGIDRLDAKLDQLNESAKKSQKSLDGVGKSAKSNFGGIGLAAGVAATGAAALAAALVAGTKSVIDINAQYQSLQANLVTVSGSTEKAAAQFKALQQFAAETPFSLEEVTKAFTSMQAYGLSTSKETLTAFGNIAGGFGRNIQDVVEAAADAVNGEFERLKAFSIKASKQGDNISFRFKGVTTTVKNNVQDIQKYLESIGQKDFAGGMARQAATINGAWSNLTDNIKNSIVELSNNADFSGIVTNVINSLSGAIDQLKIFWDAFSNSEAVTNFKSTLDSMITPIMDFMNSTVTVGGVTTTVWGQIGVAIMDAATIIINAYNLIYSGLSEIAGAFMEYGQQVVKMWQAFFGSGIGKWTAGFLTGLVNNFEAAVKTIGNGLVQIPKIILQAFTASGQIAQSFFTRLSSLLGGNLTAFSGFWEEAGNAVKKPLATAAQFGKTTFQTFTDAAKDTASGVLTIGKEIESVHKKSMNAITESRKKLSEKPKADMSALNTSTPTDPTKTIDKEAQRKAEQELKEFQQRVKALTDTYAPAVKRQLEWAQAQTDFNRLIALGDEGLKKYGLTVSQVRDMMKDAKETINRSFFQKALDDANFEGATVRASEFTDAASLAAEKVREIAKAAKDAHEVLTPAQEEELKNIYKINEETKKSIELRNKVKEANADLIKSTQLRVKDLQDEAQLLGLVGKERERAQNLLYFQTDAAASGADIDTQRKALEEYTKALDEFQKRKDSLNTFGQGLKTAITEYTESAAELAANTADAMKNVFSSFEDSLADSIKKGKLDFKSFLGTVADELAKFAARQSIALLLKLFTGFSGGGIGSLFGGLFAEGGSPPVGKASIVGEKGTEVFVPKQAGNILNASQLRALGVGNTGTVKSGGNISISMPITISGNTNMTQQQLDEFGSKITDDILKNIINQKRPGGALYN